MTQTYTGRDQSIAVAANTTVNMMPAIASPDLSAITTAEWDAGTVIECAIRKVNIQGTSKNRTDQYLCDKDAREEPGTVDWAIDPIQIAAGDPQKPDSWLASLKRGQRIFMGQRYGLPHDQAGAAGQIVSQLTELEVSLIEWVAPEANADGAKFEKQISFAVKQNSVDVPMS